MKALYLDPLIPRWESAEATLRRLSSNIGTLSGLIGDAGRTGHLYLAAMFFRSRDTKVAEAQALIALVKDENANAVEEAATPTTEGGQRYDLDNEGQTPGARLKAGNAFLPAEMLLLMDTAAASPERRFLLVGAALVGIGAASFTSRHPCWDGTRLALAEGISPSSLVYLSLPDRQAA